MNGQAGDHLGLLFSKYTQFLYDLLIVLPDNDMARTLYLSVLLPVGTQA